MEELIRDFERLESNCQLAIEKDDRSSISQLDDQMTRLWEQILAAEAKSAEEKSLLAAFLLERIAPKSGRNDVAAKCKKKILGWIKESADSPPATNSDENDKGLGLSDIKAA